MRYAVIDIGSNSVRLMMSDGKETLYKNVNTTRLAEGMGTEGILTSVAIKRTAEAVAFFCEKAQNEKADQIYVFATAAVRRAENKEEFTFAVKNLCGLDVEIISGENEAELGYIGALNGKDGGVIDIGGASAEIIVVNKGKKIYSKSLDIGAVRIKDECGQDLASVSRFVENAIVEYGQVPKTTFHAIGGTATSIVALVLELEVYDPKTVDGYVLKREVLSTLVNKLFSLSVEERKLLKGMYPPRAEVIAGGAKLLLEIMNKIQIDSVVVSERDNLEGYLIKRLG